MSVPTASTPKHGKTTLSIQSPVLIYGKCGTSAQIIERQRIIKVDITGTAKNSSVRMHIAPDGTEGSKSSIELLTPNIPLDQANAYCKLVLTDLCAQVPEIRAYVAEKTSENC